MIPPPASYLDAYLLLYGDTPKAALASHSFS